MWSSSSFQVLKYFSPTEGPCKYSEFIQIWLHTSFVKIFALTDKSSLLRTISLSYFWEKRWGPSLSLRGGGVGGSSTVVFPWHLFAVMCSPCCLRGPTFSGLWISRSQLGAHRLHWEYKTLQRNGRVALRQERLSLTYCSLPLIIPRCGIVPLYQSFLSDLEI